MIEQYMIIYGIMGIKNKGDITMNNKKQMVEIWGDVVEIRLLLMSIIISSVSTMGAYFLAPSNDKIKQLFFGLAGALLGFGISALLIKPKRIITLEEELIEK